MSSSAKHWRHRVATNRHGRRTPRCKAAAVIGTQGPFRGWGRLAFPVAMGVGIGDRADQQLRIGMLGIAHDVLGSTGLGDHAAIEHDDVLADLIGRGQIVCDVNQRDSKFLVKLAQVAQDGRSQRGVDHRDRLIGDDNSWTDQKCARHHDALALPAAQLVRIAAERLFRPQTDGAQGFRDHPPRLGS